MKKGFMVLLSGVLACVSGCSNTKPVSYLKVTNPISGALEEYFLQLSTPAKDVPVPEGGFPGLVYVHGGGWGTGDRMALDTQIQEASKQGYVAISVDYRLTTKKDAQGNTVYPWPAQIQDVNCAISWLRSHANDYHVNPNLIGILGESSGAQIALMAAESPNNPVFKSTECAYEASNEVQAAASLIGVLDLKTVWDKSEALRDDILALFNANNDPLGVKVSELPAETQAKIQAADPIENITSYRVPTMLIHPSDDWFAPAINTQNFYHTLMENFGGTAYLVRPKTGMHFFGTDGGLAKRFSMTLALSWFDIHLKGESRALPCDPGTDCELDLHNLP